MASKLRRRSLVSTARIAAQLAAADEDCARNGVQLTAQRREILELLLLRGGSAKAYDLQDDMRSRHGRIAPTTIYRALEFLMEQHLVHRVDAVNTFIVCNGRHAAHHPLLLVCSRCEGVTEVVDPKAATTLTRHLRTAAEGFAGETIEIKGICAQCGGAAPSISHRQPR